MVNLNLIDIPQLEWLANSQPRRLPEDFLHEIAFTSETAARAHH